MLAPSFLFTRYLRTLAKLHRSSSSIKFKNSNSMEQDNRFICIFILLFSLFPSPWILKLNNPNFVYFRKNSSEGATRKRHSQIQKEAGNHLWVEIFFFFFYIFSNCIVEVGFVLCLGEFCSRKPQNSAKQNVNYYVYWNLVLYIK